MNSFTCADVDERIDLYAAGECDEPEAAAIDRHLQDCGPCRQAYQETQQLLGLLDARFQEDDRLHRLRRRLEAEDFQRVHRSRIRPFVRRVASLAALFLIVAVLFQGLGRQEPSRESAPVGDLVMRTDEEATWSRTVLQDFKKEMVRTMPAHGRQGRESRPAVVVRVAPGTKWQPINRRQAELTSGKLHIQVPPSVAKEVGDAEVTTPVFATRVRGTDFRIEVRPKSIKKRPEATGHSKRPPAPVRVLILAGQAELSNSRGRVSGGRGMYLWVNAQGIPQKKGP
jgi:hypothetical protein